MNKVKYVLLIMLLLLSINVKASNCESSEKTRLKELAKKVEFDYDYKLVDDKAVFSINAVNLNQELKVLIIEDYYNEKYQEFKDNGSHTGTLNNFNEGEKVTVTIKAFVPNWCSGQTLMTKVVKLPYYNKYYDEEKCNGHEDFKYCKLLIDNDITKETFDKQYEEYLKKNEKNEKPVVEPGEDKTSLYITIGGLVLAVVIIIVCVMFLIKKRKENRL